MNTTILHAVILYTLSTCPWCYKAKELLDNKKIKYFEIVIDQMEHSERERTKQELIEKIYKKDSIKSQVIRITFPQIFINGRSIGGFSELEKLNNTGELDKLLGKQ